nr:hypothetical protein [uncultured Shewanella sp.]
MNEQLHTIQTNGLYGNSVPPLLAAALVSANYQTTINIEKVA